MNNQLNLFKCTHNSKRGTHHILHPHCCNSERARFLLPLPAGEFSESPRSARSFCVPRHSKCNVNLKWKVYRFKSLWTRTVAENVFLSTPQLDGRRRLLKCCPRERSCDPLFFFLLCTFVYSVNVCHKCSAVSSYTASLLLVEEEGQGNLNLIVCDVNNLENNRIFLSHEFTYFPGR